MITSVNLKLDRSNMIICEAVRFRLTVLTVRMTQRYGWEVPGGHCVSNHHVAAQKKGASPLPILFLALISINDNIPARTTWRANPVSVEAWLSGLKRQFAKLVKSFYRLSQVRILLLPLRVAQFTLLSFDRFRL